MSGQNIRNFPQEVTGGAWPLLRPTAEDKQYQPVATARTVPTQQVRQENADVLNYDIPGLLLKGGILGLLFFGAFFGIIRNLLFWLHSWHWAIAIVVIILLRILVGLDLTLIVLALIVIVAGLTTMITNPFFIPLLLAFIVGGILLRGAFELLPVSRHSA